MKLSISIIFLLVLTTVLFSINFSAEIGDQNKLEYNNIWSDIKFFSSFKSRFTGYSGFYSSGDYIYSVFKDIFGENNVRVQSYNVLSPIDEGSSIEIIKEKIVFDAYGMYPNLIATGKVKDLTGKLYYAHKGDPSELNIPLNNSIILMDFDSGDSWIRLIKFGVKAVIFIGSNYTTRFETYSKFIQAPLNFPRLYVTPRVGRELLKYANGSMVKINLNMSLKLVKAYNYIGIIEGSKYRDKAIIFMAHYDSASVVPALSPGADDSIGISLLLELARTLSKTKPKYTLVFVAVSGHWQGLAGAREFVDEYFFGNFSKKYFPFITFGFEISSGAAQLVPTLGGFFYSHRHANLVQTYSTLFGFIQKIFKSYSELNSEYYNCIISEEVRTGEAFSASTIFNGYAFPFISDVEAVGLTGSLGITFVTFKDSRVRLFTPIDTLENVDKDNLIPQIDFIEFLLERILDIDPGKLYTGSISQITPTRLNPRPAGGTGFANLKIEVVKYDPTHPKLYSPVPNSIVVIYKVRAWYASGYPYTRYNPFGYIINITDGNGKLYVKGLPILHAAAGAPMIYAYKVDEKSGEITYFPDEGSHGAGIFPHMVEIRQPIQTVRTVVFEGGCIVLPDIILPDKLWSTITLGTYYNPFTPIGFTYYESPLTISIDLFEAVSYVKPLSYGSYYEPTKALLLLYVPKGYRIQATVSATGQARKIILLLNNSMNNPDGYGYLFKETGRQYIVTFSIYKYAKQIYYIAYTRYEKARVQGIRDPSTEKYLNLASYYLNLTEKSIEENNYVLARKYSIDAWSNSLKAYDRSRGLLIDFTYSTVLIMLLVAPFAVLFEALIISSIGYRRGAMIILISIIVFFLLRFLHPGFNVVTSLPALVMGIILITLAIPAVFFLFLEFNYGISEVRKLTIGLHFLERSRFDILLSSLSIGVQNMKKRKLRTFLTFMAVILMVMSLVSLSSVVPLTMISRLKLPPSGSYNGILVRSYYYDPLSTDLYNYLKVTLGDQWYISERYWCYGPFLITAKGRNATIDAVIGLSPDEKHIAFSEVARSLRGEWFSKYDIYSCIISEDLANLLGVDYGDIIIFRGLKLIVRGIFDKTFASESVIDIDGNTILPIDREEVDAQQRFSFEFRYDWDSVIIVPSHLARTMPGFFISSIAASPKQRIEMGRSETVSENEIFEKASEIFNTLDGLVVVAKVGDDVYEYNKMFTQTVFGGEFIIIPTIIVGLVVTMTILGNIYERTREMYIYSSLGLAPLHVASMFISENLVYAIVGGLLGYILGIVNSKILNISTITGGYIGTNYSGSSVMFVMGMVMLLVMLSSLYPFIKVAKIVTPSLERKWRPKTKPKGDDWEIPLPFTYTDEREILGLMAFLQEYMNAKKIERTGTFSVLDVNVGKEAEEYRVDTKVWLAPFELNIVQQATITFLKSKTERKIFTLVRLHRFSGPYDQWMTTNVKFIDNLRKQFLTWRLLKVEDRDKYVEMGKKLILGE